jgi:predicted DNA-binding transcriptional regulator AlpA
LRFNLPQPGVSIIRAAPQPRNSRPKFEGEIQPGQFYRYSLGPLLFGYESTVLAEKIKSGDIPKPVYLSVRIKGWFGRTILAWQAAQEAKTAEREVQAQEENARLRELRLRTMEQQAQAKQKAEKAEQPKPKVKKVKMGDRLTQQRSGTDTGPLR